MGTTCALVVTGGASGIGAAMVRDALGRQWPVAFCDVVARDKVPADLLTETSWFAQVDVRSLDAVKSFRDGAVRFLGDPGRVLPYLGVVASAGVSRRGDPAQVQMMNQINLGGTRNLLQAFAPDLQPGRGLFVGLSSIVAAEGMAVQGDEAYQATKAETRKIATEEAAGMGVTGFAVAPGAIDTPMLRAEAIMGMLLLGAARVYGGDTQHALHAKMADLAGKPPGTPAAEILKGILGPEVTGTDDFQKVDKALAKDPSLARAGAALFTSYVCPRGADGERHVRADVIAKAADTLRALDVVIGPETVARVVLDQVAAQRAPEGGLLRAYSQHGGNPILQILASASK
jgi:NAD(P)-dependent dehydrogenase (short-subunit alcohol dehydrogenase family)